VKILVVGRGSGGSWEIRGRQLGNAIGATVDPNPAKLKGYDLAIIVKRPRADLLARLHSHGLPVIWDVVDAWPQPHGNEWDEAMCKGWLRTEVERVRPWAIVASTRQMARDCEELKDVDGFGLPVRTVPHHARPGQRLNPIRDKVQAVGYQGGLQYLGFWQRWLEIECAARGWRFALNPAELADVDILVAVRAQTGYAARNWKSNVKLANAQGSATPIICGREAGYLEWSRGIRWADATSEMPAALYGLSDFDARRKISVELFEGTPKLEDVAAQYRDWLERLPIATAQAA
jgi:hypothetical protein